MMLLLPSLVRIRLYIFGFHILAEINMGLLLADYYSMIRPLYIIVASLEDLVALFVNFHEMNYL